MRTVLRVLGRLVPVGLAVALAARWLDVAARGTVPVVQALAPLWVALTAVALVVVLLARRWRVLAWYVPAVALAAYVAAVDLTASGGAAQADTPGRELVVASLNADYGGADPDAVVRVARDRRVDVLVLLEVNADYLARLDEAGMVEVLPYRSHAARDNPVTGSMILTGHPIVPVVEPPEPGAYAFEQPAADISLAGRTVRVRAAHPWPPVLGGASAWRGQLDDLRVWARAQPPEVPLVLAGDFNASTAHPVFRRLTDDLVDAVDAAGPRLAPTWPRGRLVVPPFVALDHVLSRGAPPRDAGTFVVDGTDHAGVWARLRVP
ncbi:endonuclease/exonuclease/phosphatase family protein [Mumia sp. DW29H23]|uniref:endonuclease/exonuclease/phosphatase family protein n=1 Tax=Mumia sp. DW29H23 TaxID=3421241 RepID=UPI003D69129E